MIPFLVGRFVYGIICGLFSSVAPIYLSEIAPRNLRGAMSTLHQFIFLLGLLIANILGSSKIFGTSELWICLYAVKCALAAVCFGLSIFCFESPKFVYIKQNDSEKARKSEINFFWILLFWPVTYRGFVSTASAAWFKLRRAHPKWNKWIGIRKKCTTQPTYRVVHRLAEVFRLATSAYMRDRCTNFTSNDHFISHFSWDCIQECLRECPTESASPTFYFAKT